MCTTIIRSGELLSVVTPSARTSSGRRGVAIATRFWTSTCALSRSVPSLNVIGQRHGAVGRRIGRHVEHVLDAVDLLLERRRHGGGDGLRIGARDSSPAPRWSAARSRDIARPAASCRRCRRRAGRRSTGPWRRSAGRRRSGRSAWRSPQRGIQLPLRSRIGGRVVICGVTLMPGRTRTRPLTTTVSSPFSPSRMTR